MSVHIEASLDAIAPTVLLPGDPLRAKWIAETFLTEATCYNQVRGMLGYTGYYNNQRISVQGSGMGIPSTLIYGQELICEYKVKQLIRVGSAGSYQLDLGLGALVVALSASTDSAFNSPHFQQASYAPTASPELFLRAMEYAKKQSVMLRAGNVLSTDIFYDEDKAAYKKWADYGVLCAEMETAALYTLAAKYGIDALSVLTISDSLVTGEQLSAVERESSFHEMVTLALNIV